MVSPVIGSSTELVAGADGTRSWAIALQTSPVRFYPAFGPLPAVTDVIGQPETWDAVGYTRTLQLSDGGSVVETITDATPEFFAYDLSEFQKILGRLVSGARAEWTFTPAGSGTNIHWSYVFFPLPGRAFLVRAIVRLFWARYMRRVLAVIVDTIEARGARHPGRA
jgi:hypothetical protein